MKIREYTDQDLKEIIRIWNEVVEEGIAFPQEETLDMKSGAVFFASQSYTGVAEEDGKIFGLYILHPNNHLDQQRLYTYLLQFLYQYFLF